LAVKLQFYNVTKDLLESLKVKGHRWGSGEAKYYVVHR